jgi:hypothetical protein
MISRTLFSSNIIIIIIIIIIKKNKDQLSSNPVGFV